jgi:ribosome-binding ATPase YchF (GTP1/OBG family)
VSSVGGEVAQAANYPFCTIDPNVGLVNVPDRRLTELAAIYKSENTIPAAVSTWWKLF